MGAGIAQERTSSPASALRRSFLEGNHCPTGSITDSLPFPYHWIPGEVRLLLARLLYRKTLRNLITERRAPETYAENAADLLAADLASASDGGPFWSWPGGSPCALVLSHDVDTPGQQRGIEGLRAVAERHGLRATFNFVGRDIEHYQPIIRDLRAGGHEIGLHDVVHDNRVAFLSEEAIVARLAPMRRWQEKFDIRGFRSPSWYTSPALWSGLLQAGFTHDMSALDTWSFFTARRNFGVASFFPFLVDGLALLPTTIPFEVPWYCGYHPSQALDFWQPKLDVIARNGGLIMINAHPDPWWCGSPAGMQGYRRCVDHLMSQHRPASLTAAQAADHLRAQSRAGATLVLPGPQTVELPRHQPASLVLAANVANPMLAAAPVPALAQRYL